MGRADKNTKELTARKNAFSAALNYNGIKSGVERTILTLFCTLLLSNQLFYAKLQIFFNSFVTHACVHFSSQHQHCLAFWATLTN